MRGGLKVGISLSMLLVALQGLAPQPPSLGDLLRQAWQAEQQSNHAVAASAYARALALRPNDPLLHLKRAETLILLNRPDEAARHLAQALELFAKDPTTPVDLKVYVCDLLMARSPLEVRWQRWRFGGEGWLYPAPLTTLPAETQKHLVSLVPKEWLFPNEVSEAWFLLNVGEQEKGLSRLRDAVLKGQVNSALNVLTSRLFTDGQRQKVAEEWRREAQRSGNAFLWLVTLHLLWRTKQMDAFRSDFPKAIAAMKGQTGLLLELAQLCERMRWDEGLKRLQPMLPFVPKDEPSLLAEFRRALDDGDLAKVKALLRSLTDIPDAFRRFVLSPESIRKMLGHGWHEFVVELLQPELVTELPPDTKQVLLWDAAFHPSRFAHWMRLFMSVPVATDLQQAMVNLLVMTAADFRHQEPERGIWLLEQGLRLFPDEPNLVERLAGLYERAGYPERAVALLQEALLQFAEVGIVHSATLSQLWDIASRTQRLNDLVAWLKERRERLPLGYFVEMARHALRHNRPQEALQWLDDAFAIAKERGFSTDPEKHAQAYYLLRQLDPQSEEAKRLRALVAPTVPLFHPETYEMRLECLVRLRKMDEARKLLDEVQRLYPTYPFTERVQGLARIAVTDWKAELNRLAEQWRNAPVPKSDLLIRLAHATVKAGRTAEVEKIADELMAGQPFWHEGYQLAVDLFSRRIPALIPFVRWAQKAVPNQHFAGWRFTVMSIGEAISKAGDPSLASAFLIASVLLPPQASPFDKPHLVEVEQLLQTDAHRWFGALTAQDRDALKTLLARERLNPFAFQLLAMQVYRPDVQNEWHQWFNDLAQSQSHSAHFLICQMQKRLNQITRDELRQSLNALAKADWSEVNWCPFTFLRLPERLARRGFREEAIELLKLATRFAPPQEKADLMAQLTQLTGKPPETPKGEDAKDSEAWLTQAQAFWKAQRYDEAKRTALKVLEMTPSLNEQAEALRILADADPELALRLATERLPNFLVAEPHSDPPMPLQRFADALFHIAERRKDLAAQVVRPLERIVNFSPMMKVNTCYRLALTHFWAGNQLRGIAVLFEPLDKGEVAWNLRQVIGAMVRADVPENARQQIAQHLRDYLKKHRPSLSLLADELESVREIGLAGAFDAQTHKPVVELAPDSLIALATMLKECAEQAEGVMPRKFVEVALRNVKGFAVIQRPATKERFYPESVVEAWWQLFEAAFQKAMKTGSPQSLKRWLRQFYLERPDTDFSQTVWFERLKKLAE
jgi:tetratricopeptide (TPR) repeat protein